MRTSVELFEQLEFKENPLYEKIISGLLEDNYCIVENFFNLEEVGLLRKTLLDKYETCKNHPIEYYR